MNNYLLTILAVLLVSLTVTASAQRSALLLADIDSIILDADFIGVVEVHSTSVEEDGILVELAVRETWFSRWDERKEFVFSYLDPSGTLNDTLQEGHSMVVFISGGEWRATPFTFRQHSVFPIREDGHVGCVTDELFGLTSAGFVCSTADRTVGDPLTESVFRSRIMSLREAAVARDPQLARELSRPRPFRSASSRRASTHTGVIR